jgi:hypothetical protein
MRPLSGCAGSAGSQQRQPLYLAYPDPAALGSIATAIGRAYLPHLTSRRALRLLTKLRRPHASRGPVQQSETHRCAITR